MATRPGCIIVLPLIRRLLSAFDRLNAIQILEKREREHPIFAEIISCGVGILPAL